MFNTLEPFNNLQKLQIIEVEFSPLFQIERSTNSLTYFTYIRTEYELRVSYY